MIHKITLKPNQAAEIVKTGQFIKVLNCENRFKLNATRQGSEVAFTDAGAGFDLSTITPFDKIAIQSEVNQTVEIWVSAHKLSYDALSTKPSKSSSYIVEHFGQTQQILPYDPSQSGALIYLPQKSFYVGGEGVNDENGMFIDIGEKYRHDSAAPLYAYISDPITYKALVNEDPRDHTIAGSISGHVYANYYEAYIKGKFYSFRTDSDSKIIDIDAMYSTNVKREGDYGEFISLPCEGWGGVWALRVAAANTIEIGKIVGDDGLTETMKINISSEEEGYVFVRAFVIAGDYAICAAQRYNEEHKFFIIDRDGNYSVKTLPSQFGEIPHSLQFDPYTGKIWCFFDGGIYTCTADLTNFERFSSKPSGYIYQMQFSEEHVGIVGHNRTLIYKRDGTQIGLNTGFKGVFFGGNSQILVVVGTQIQESLNGGISFNVVYDNIEPLTGSNVDCVHFFENKGKVYFTSREDGSNTPALKSFESGADISNPKAKFRVFKESF